MREPPYTPELNQAEPQLLYPHLEFEASIKAGSCALYVATLLQMHRRVGLFPVMAGSGSFGPPDPQENGNCGPCLPGGELAY